jgi:hypothetical protein
MAVSRISLLLLKGYNGLLISGIFPSICLPLAFIMKKLFPCDYRLRVLLVFISLNNGLWAQTPDPMFPGFTDVAGTLVPGVEGVDESYVVWGDYDNDNDLDFILSGSTYTNFGGGVSQIWENSSGVFVNRTATVAPGFPQIEEAHFEWGDYDHDNDPDLLLTGSPDESPGICQVWINDVNHSGVFTQAPISLPDNIVSYSSVHGVTMTMTETWILLSRG